MSGDGVDRDSLMEVCLVFNGPLEMSAGKMAGQAYQAVYRATTPGTAVVEHVGAEEQWVEQGTRTVVRVAKTSAMFERVCAEVDGYVMRDEGFTEVDEDAVTLFVSVPYLHRDRPQVLNNKKVPLL